MQCSFWKVRIQEASPEEKEIEKQSAASGGRKTRSQLVLWAAEWLEACKSHFLVAFGFIIVNCATH